MLRSSGRTRFPRSPRHGRALVFTLVKVDNGVAGKAPTVTFLSKDYAGNAVPMSALTTTPNRIALVMAGPTSDYGYTSFGSDVTTPGYVSENPAPTAKCGSDGTCTYTFTHSIPAKATGTYTIGIEGRRGITLLAGTTQQMSSEYGAINKTINFSVDGSPVATRRKVVDIAKCNGCHSALSLHGENRNQIEQCVMCHNPSENDASVRGISTTASDKTLPAQSVNFAMMIHKIHTGEQLAADFNTNYRIVGFGGSRSTSGSLSPRSRLRFRTPASATRRLPIRARWATRRNATCAMSTIRKRYSPSGRTTCWTRRAESARRRLPRPLARLAIRAFRRCLTRYRRPIRSSVKAATSATLKAQPSTCCRYTRANKQERT